MVKTGQIGNQFILKSELCVPTLKYVGVEAQEQEIEKFGSWVVYLRSFIVRWARSAQRNSASHVCQSQSSFKTSELQLLTSAAYFDCMVKH